MVVYEKLGMAKPIQLREQGITPENLTEHFVLRNEFVLQRCGTTINNDGHHENNLSRTRIVSVLDVKGIAVGDITTDVLAFLRISGQVVDHHYPGLVAKLIICNAPSWFWTVWGMIARVLPEKTRESIQIIGDTTGLDKYIDKTMRPAEYGGTDVPLGQRAEFTSFVELGQDWENEGYVLYETLAEARKAKRRGNDERELRLQLILEQVNSRAHRKHLHNRKNGTAIVKRAANGKLLKDSTDDDNDGEENHRNGINNNDQSQSIYRWIRNGFKRPEQKHAFLGEKNCFRYDEERGVANVPLTLSQYSEKEKEGRVARLQ